MCVCVCVTKHDILIFSRNLSHIANSVHTSQNSSSIYIHMCVCHQAWHSSFPYSNSKLTQPITIHLHLSDQFRIRTDYFGLVYNINQIVLNVYLCISHLTHGIMRCKNVMFIGGRAQGTSKKVETLTTISESWRGGCETRGEVPLIWIEVLRAGTEKMERLIALVCLIHSGIFSVN